MTNLPPSPPNEGGRVSAWIAHAKGLTFTNVAVIALLLLALIPAYFLYRAIGDPALLDRVLSSYEEIATNGDCTIRVVAERGGPQRWSVSTGFAFAGSERWAVSVILDHAPGDEEIASHCATLLLIVEKMHEP
jgi:hypothetical protein